MGLWLPPGVSADLYGKRLARDAAIEAQGRTDDVCDRFNREVRRTDEYVRMVFFGDDTTVPGATPGRFHLVRRPPDGPATLICISGPQGEFVEPVFSAIFAKLAEGDLWNSRSTREREHAQREAERAGERARARESEARREDIRERYDAISRAQVSMSRDTPWSQNHSGRRGRRRAA